MLFGALANLSDVKAYVILIIFTSIIINMKFLYVFLLLLFSCAGVNKDLINVYGLSKVKVYTPAVEKGFTTASASV